MNNLMWERFAIIVLAVVVVIETGLLVMGVRTEIEQVPPGMVKFDNGDVSFFYDDSFEDGEAQEPYTFLDDTLVALRSEEASYVPMNFTQDQWIVVSREELDEATCFGGIENEQAAFDDVSTYNNVTFRVAAFEDAGAGNRYESTVHRTMYDGYCYEIATTLHYASDWTEVDQGAIDASLDAGRAMLGAAVQSFQFID